MRNLVNKSLKVILIFTVLVFFSRFIHAANKNDTIHPVKVIKILTIGNSFAENAGFFLNEITESVPGNKIIITKANIGGCSLEKHSNLIKECEGDSTLKSYYNQYTLKNLLETDQYDFVTIQQYSAFSFKPETYQPYADNLCQSVHEHVPGAKIVIHQTWAYSSNCERLKQWGISRDEMHKGLVACYNKLAEHLNAEMLPSGNAFYTSYKKHPQIDLWKQDRYHANEYGCYLAGCVWFGKLFNISPVKIKFVPDGFDPKTAIFLRRIAAQGLKKRNNQTLIK